METTQTPTTVDIKSMLEAGAHFGHQTHRWNPKMLPYIFGTKNGIHIINLDLTMKLWERARKMIVDTVSRGGTVLFVGTKEQSRTIVEFESKRCGALYVTRRWLGGILSNFETCKRSFDKFRRMEDLLAKSEDETTGVKLTKKEKLDIRRQIEKLEANLGGLRTMKALPSIVFVCDVGKEEIAVREAKRVGLPIVALVDTNVNPDDIDFPIPANDDAMRAVKLFLSAAADAVIEGNRIHQSRGTRGEEGRGERGGSSKGARSEHAVSASNA